MKNVTTATATTKTTASTTNTLLFLKKEKSHLFSKIPKYYEIFEIISG